MISCTAHHVGTQLVLLTGGVLFGRPPPTIEPFPPVFLRLKMPVRALLTNRADNWVDI